MSSTQGQKRPTIKDIAKLAGCSHVTVSQALRDLPVISDATKEKINKIAKEIGYTPNITARNLALQKPNSIGMIVPALGPETAYNVIINCISELAAKENLCLLLGSCNRDIELEKAYCRIMCENRVGALIISSCTSDVSHIKKMCTGIVPVIFIGGKTGTLEENYIFPDTCESGKTAVNYLYKLGHRRIGIFLYYPDNTTIRNKLKGYSEAMNNHGLEPLVYWNGNSKDTFNAGFSLTEKLIEKKELPTAIWCASDLMAVGVIEALKKHNIVLGKQVSVIGHDDLFLSEMPSVDLTTLALPKEEMAIHAMNFAKELLMYSVDNSLPKPECKVKLNTKLVIRNSTGPLI